MVIRLRARFRGDWVNLFQLLQTADKSYTLYSKAYKETFHSQKGALTESKHVFLEGAGVYEYLRQKKDVAILEVGFGTGLNFFLTADACSTAGVKLIYTALEKELLEFSIIKELGYNQFLAQPKILNNFLTWREDLSGALVIGEYEFIFENQQLNLCIGEATKYELGTDLYDAIYLDAFSPDTNPELWSASFLQKLYQALAPKGRLSSYCVKGEVRRRMQDLGFKVEKRPGPPSGKREMLLASRQ